VAEVLMPVQLIQPSFAAGELSPFLYQRVDLAKYKIGLRTCLNWFIHPTGGASNCPGTAWVGEILDSSKAGRLIPFTYSISQTYMLEFGDQKLRFITNAGYVLESTKAITAATKANPGHLTITGHGYSTGDRLYLASLGGMVQLNNRFVDVTVIDANTISIGLDTTGFTTYTSGGTAARLYTLATPYTYTDLPLLKYEQSADTMTLTRKGYSPRKLARVNTTTWTLTEIVFAPKQTAPTNVTSSAGGSSFLYAVTAISDSTGEESLQSADCGSSGQTSTLSWTALDGASQYNVYKKKNGVYGFIGFAQISSGTSVSFTDSTIDPNTSITPPQQRNPFASNSISAVTVTSGGSGYASPTLSITDKGVPVTSVSLTPHVTGGVITSVTVNNGGKGLNSPVIQITDGAGSGASLQINWVTDGGQIVTGSDGNGDPVYSPTYQIGSVTVLAGGSGYHANAGVSLINIAPNQPGTGGALAAVVSGGAVASITVVAPGNGYYSQPGLSFPVAQVYDSTGAGAVLTPVLSGDPNVFPGSNTYHDGRQWFMSSVNQPLTLWGSVSGSFNSMAVSVPTQDSDAITRTLASRQVNDIRHGISMANGLILFTSGSEWKISAGSADVITPAQFVARPQSYNGCSDLPPIVVNDMILYVPANQKKIRGLQYQWAADTWSGPDFSLLASHLWEQNTIVAWGYARDPDSIVWGIRDDGVAVAFTFNNEQQVYAFARRTTTNGTFESMAVVQEGGESAVYFIVKRTINGVTKRYVERLHTRVFPTIADAWFLDCAAEYSGSAATTISGLWHLVGEQVYALADGVPVGPFTVSAAGSITLQNAASKVIVGKIIPDADLELMDIDLQDQAGSVQGRKKKLNHVTLGLKNSANTGITAGPSGGQSTTLYALKPKDLVNPLASAPSSAPALITDIVHQVAAPSWDWHGRVLIRVSASPLPYTVTGAMADVSVG
jgi:hypothetical protein